MDCDYDCDYLGDVGHVRKQDSDIEPVQDVNCVLALGRGVRGWMAGPE